TKLAAYGRTPSRGSGSQPGSTVSHGRGYDPSTPLVLTRESTLPAARGREGFPQNRKIPAVSRRDFEPIRRSAPANRGRYPKSEAALSAERKRQVVDVADADAIEVIDGSI